MNFLDPDTSYHLPWHTACHAQISTMTMVSLHIDGIHFEDDWHGARSQATIVITQSQTIAAFERLTQGVCGETTLEISASQTMSIETRNKTPCARNHNESREIGAMKSCLHSAVQAQIPQLILIIIWLSQVHLNMNAIPILRSQQIRRTTIFRATIASILIL